MVRADQNANRADGKKAVANPVAAFSHWRHAMQLIEPCGLERAIRAMTDQIETRIANCQTTVEKVEETRKVLALTWAEFARLQEIKSMAVVAEAMSLEDGQYLYELLGESGPPKINACSAATLAVINEVFKGLLAWSTAGAKSNVKIFAWDR